MALIKCNECGKEISTKAEMCPNCGVRVKKKGIVSKIFKWLEIICVIFVMTCILFLGFLWIKNHTKKEVEENEKEKYIGVWKLQSKSGNIEYNNKSIIIDDELEIKEENVYYGMELQVCGDFGFEDANIMTKRCDEVPISVRLSYDDKVSAINFNLTNGYSILFCFDNDGDTLKQRSCKGINSDLYSSNGGIDEDFGIVYKKMK